MMTLPDLPAGVYRHYKGNLYQVLGYGHDANADTLVELAIHPDTQLPGYRAFAENERLVVVYIGLQLDDAHTGPRLAVRTADDFRAEVCGDPECMHYGLHTVGDAVCLERHSVPRFRYLGPDWRG